MQATYCRKLDANHDLLLIAMIIENLCLYLWKMCEQIYNATGVNLSGATICRFLRCGYSKKKYKQLSDL